MTTVINGKEISEQIKSEIAREVAEMVAAGHRAPHLAAVLVGHDPASETYVNNKVKACLECGFSSTLIRREDDVTEEELLDIVDRLNHDDNIDGFLVQLPLPAHIDEDRIIEAIDWHKDVDGFHPVNVGRMALGLPCFVPATPAGILYLLEHYNIPTEGRHCAVLGRSNIVGRPVATLMMRKGYPGNATVTVCHRATTDLADICRRSDIIITAMGQPRRITADMVKPGAAIIDIGTTLVPDATKARGYRLCGDVDFENVAPIASFITPVPGGVGPMTIAMLMKNTLLAAKKSIYR